jgi:hypothetical protein
MNHFSVNTTFSMRQQPSSGLDRLFVEAARSHTIRHSHTNGRTPLNEWSALDSSRYLQNTDKTQRTGIHALSGIRIYGRSNQEAANPRLRPHGHWDQLTTLIMINYNTKSLSGLGLCY